jgi:tetratricopeptide (TPR) repeat protein
MLSCYNKPTYQLALDNSIYTFILIMKLTVMSDNLAQNAIAAALSGNWKKAEEVNKKILKENPKDIEALNRLSRAHAELGNLTKARRTAKKVLKIDPFNTIATKSFEKWRGLKKGETYSSCPSSARVFLEEPGKTKILSLLHVGSAKILGKLDSGDEVKLNSHSHRVSVVTARGDYIGRLPDDLSARLKKLIMYGNEYRVFIKSINKSKVKIFIRETKRSKRLAKIPSFSTEKINYVSFTPPELVHKRRNKF